MFKRRSATLAQVMTIVGLVIGACGIAILWAAGVPFPIYPPPGILILGVGAIFVSLAPWRWTPSVGAFLGLFVLVGFLISPTGVSNLLGRAGASVALGQGVQVIGVLTALVAGVTALFTNYQKQKQGVT